MKYSISDLYIDYIICSFGQVSATGLSSVLDGAVSHDRITRMLSEPEQTSKELWMRAKPVVREIEDDDGVLIIDDSIEKKPSTDESELICWHYDHTKGHSVKGVNFISALYHNRNVSVPVGVHLVTKPDLITDPKTGKLKRKAELGKNHCCRELIAQAIRNNLRFRYVCTDIWFASAENMMHIHRKHGKHFVVPIKSNRNVALSLDDKKKGRYIRADAVPTEDNSVREVWLESVDFPLIFAKQVFTNEDGSTGVLYLVSSDTGLSYERMTAIYQKRWNVECYHKSLKQNASLEKSPTKTIRTQTNHFFASIYAYIRLESLKISSKMNHFALKNKLYIKAVQQAFVELQKLQESVGCVT